MSDPTINGYAKALLEIARSEGQIERVADELFRVSRVLASEHDLRLSLTDISVSTEAKEKLLAEILKQRVSPHTLNILAFVVAQGRVRDLVEIADNLARMAEEESRREIAEVRTAIALSDEQTRRLGEALGRSTGKTLTVKVIVDKAVIGGVWAKIGDLVIDGSVRHRLESLRDHLKTG